MEHVIIRQALPKDARIVQTIGAETFIETFGHSNTQADMDAYIADNFSEQKMTEELRNPDALFFVAYINREAVGYLKVNSGKAQTELQEEDSLEIERIY